MRSRSIILLSLAVLVGCSRLTTTGPGSGPGPEASGSSSSSGQLSYPEVLVMALNGNHDAEFELGAMFHDGDGAEQDYAKALEWYTKAATAGNRQAALNLGLMYKNGEGTTANPDAAKVWFTRASDAGDVRAAYQLGQIAYLGQDYEKAMALYLKAAKGGLAEAQMNVGVMNIRNEGVNGQNLIEGYAWLSLAADGENERASMMLITLTDKLTDEQKKQGEERKAMLKKDIRQNAGPNAL